MQAKTAFKPGDTSITQMTILNIDAQNLDTLPYLHKALIPVVNLLKNNGVVAAPTDTVYGYLVDATSNSAVQRLFKIKRRPLNKKVSIFVPSIAWIKSAIDTRLYTPKHVDFLSRVLPGPFTVVLKLKNAIGLSQLITGLDNWVGIRMIKHPIVEGLVSALELPLTATSANISGLPSVNTPNELISQYLEHGPPWPDLIIAIQGRVKGNELSSDRLPSTVFKLKEDKVEILRKGQGEDTLFKIAKTFGFKVKDICLN